MLVALLVVDCVLKKFLLRSFHRRGNLPGFEASEKGYPNYFSKEQSVRPSSIKKFDLYLRLKNSSKMNSTAQQTPATGTVSVSESIVENAEDTVNDNATIM